MLFPAPLGPTSATVEPEATLSDTSLSTGGSCDILEADVLELDIAAKRHQRFALFVAGVLRLPSAHLAQAIERGNRLAKLGPYRGELNDRKGKHREKRDIHCDIANGHRTRADGRPTEDHDDDDRDAQYAVENAVAPEVAVIVAATLR